MPSSPKSLIIVSSAILFLTGCSGSNKQTESALDSSTSSASSNSNSSTKASGMTKWLIDAPNHFSGVKWNDVADNYPPADLKISPDDDFNARIKTLLNGESYNLDEYICTNNDPKKLNNGFKAQVITCVIPAFQEYSYFIDIIDSSNTHAIYAIKDLSVNKYLGKERESDPERIYNYDISDIESLPFMDTNAMLVELDRGYKLSYSQGTDSEVSTDYHTYEHYIIAGNEMRLVTHWSAKHTQSMSDWMSCDRSNPDPKVCPSVQSEQTCNRAVFDGKTWNINKSDCP